MGNMTIYDAVRTVPQEAQKPIKAGRLAGMTDINPMWRIKILTEVFGPVGFGWYYKITDKWLDIGSDAVVVANIAIDLYVKQDDEWSMPIPGLGGSCFVAKEAKGPYTSDEAYKMALTDALSVACKALGIAADIYFSKDRSKYDASQHIAADSASAANAPATSIVPLQAQPLPGQPTQVLKNAPRPAGTTYEPMSCCECDAAIDAAVKKYSIDKFGRPLCRACQKKQIAI